MEYVLKNGIVFDPKNNVNGEQMDIFIKDDKILVQRDRDGSEYALPDGHIKICETLENGLIREIMEEMGVQIECRRLLWSEECFWEWNGKQVHNISFYYLIKLCDDFEIPDNGEFVSQKDNCNVVIGWMPIDQLQNITIYPEFLNYLDVTRINLEVILIFNINKTIHFPT